MTTINVTQSHSKSVDDAKSSLGDFEKDLSKYGMKITWSGSNADLKGTGASGAIRVTDAQVTVEVKLGMMAKMAGVKPDLLQKSIEKRLKSALGDDS